VLVGAGPSRGQQPGDRIADLVLARIRGRGEVGYRGRAAGRQDLADSGVRDSLCLAGTGRRAERVLFAAGRGAQPGPGAAAHLERIGDRDLLVIGATLGVVAALVPLRYAWQASALLPFALLVTGIGYSLVIGGLTLAGKRIQMLQEAMLILVLLFTFSAVPVVPVPGWFAGIGHYFPVTAAVASLYGVLLGHRPVTTWWGTGGLVWVLATAAAYLATGIAVFTLGERFAKTRGTLARY
jgi:hypothetical protein